MCVCGLFLVCHLFVGKMWLCLCILFFYALGYDLFLSQLCVCVCIVKRCWPGLCGGDAIRAVSMEAAACREGRGILDGGNKIGENGAMGSSVVIHTS